MKVALAQTNPVVGDIAGNAETIGRMIERAADAGADLAVLPELSTVGYPPRDLLRKERFVRDSQAAVRRLARRCTRTAALVGFVRPAASATGRALENAAALLADGAVRHVYVKSLLPTYDVFDETRYFQPGPGGDCLDLAGRRVGLTICEDLWDAQALGRELYGRDPLASLTQAGAEVVVNMSASPYQMGKLAVREDLLRRQAASAAVTLVYVNQVGGNDELIFDGASCVVAPDGQFVARAASFREDLLVVDLDAPPAPPGEAEDEIPRLSEAMKLGLRDYVRKCGFRSVVLGLSGGIDSAVVATLAADALGGENVLALGLPSRYSSDHSLRDAKALADNLGVAWRVVGIEPMHAAFEKALGGLLSGERGETAAENIQARVRGLIVMAFSNAEGRLALATGNKSELSTGYCTLYGDMVGALAPIGDLLKTTVYRLGRRLNEEAGFARIPESTFAKPPSAELKPGQVDQDKLPPYELLDEILKRYIESDATAGEIIAAGLPPGEVNRALRMVDLAEYKRKQAAPVLKVTARAFGTGRRMPIAQNYRPLQEDT